MSEVERRVTGEVVVVVSEGIVLVSRRGREVRRLEVRSIHGVHIISSTDAVYRYSHKLQPSDGL